MQDMFIRICAFAFFVLGCASADVKKAEPEQAPLPAPQEVQQEVSPKAPEPEPLQAEDSGKLVLKRIAVASTLKDKEPVDAGEVFPATVGKLHCFTHIVNAKGKDQIAHNWYYGDKVVSRVSLKVGGISWRTHSTKTISPWQKGPWKVEVIGPAGEILGEARFEIK